jgi:hypothetical protein
VPRRSDVAERKAHAQILKQPFARRRWHRRPEPEASGPGVLFVGVGQFAFFFALAEIYYPGYDVSTQTISDLRHPQERGLQFRPAVIRHIQRLHCLLGVTLLFTAYLLWKGCGSKALTSSKG